MNRRAVFLATLALASCGTTASPAPDTPAPPPPAVVVVVPRPVIVPAPPPAADPIAKLTPQQLAAAAEAAKTDATGYVVWKGSSASNIECLTILTHAVNTAVDKMAAGAIGGKYRPEDVTAARVAIKKLRTFLANKGD